MRRAAGRSGLLAALAVLAGASPAGAAVTIGQVSPATPIACSGSNDFAQLAVASGNSYTVPSTGGIVNWTIASWSTNANANPGSLKLKFFRSLGGMDLQAVAQDGPRALNVSSLNTFQTNLRVKAGDLLGLHNDPGTGCSFAGEAGDQRLFLAGDLADGQSATFSGPIAGRLNISAQADPTNTFTQGAITRNKKKGTATATFDVPNPGQLTASGNGVKASGAGARTSAAVPGPGNATLTIRAKGKKKRKLRSKGKVKLSPTFTYTPTGGTARTLSTTVKLRKKLKRK